MDVISILGASFVVAGLLFFIFNNAIKTANFKKRALYFFIFGLLLVAAVFFGIFKDYKAGLLNKTTFGYFAFPITIFSFFILFTVINLIKAKKYNHRFMGFKSQTDKSKVEYLYVLYKYKDNYLLEFDSEYKGIIIKFEHKVYFHDEMIKKLLNKEDMDIIKHKFCGTITTKQKRRTATYYCYEIELASLNDELRKYEIVNKFDIVKINMSTFHKNIILRMLINKEFNINE